MKIRLLALIIFLSSNLLIAQIVGINDTDSAPDPSAMLDVQSTTKGMLIPRMTTALRELITDPATGLMVYDDSTDDR